MIDIVRICGIDPGINGALALVVVRSPVATLNDAAPMPVRTTSHGLHLTDTERLRTILYEWKPDVVVAERQAPRPGNAAAAMFTAGMMFGSMLEAVLANGVPLRLVTPIAWKKAVGLVHRPKNDALAVAAEIFGDVEFLRTKRGERTRQHIVAVAEAALMAWAATARSATKRYELREEERGETAST